MRNVCRPALVLLFTVLGLALVGMTFAPDARAWGPSITNLSTTPLLATEGTAAYFVFQATGGTPPYVWSAIPGALPSWINLSPDGILSGSPAVAGATRFTVTVTDTLGAANSKVFQLAVDPVGIVSEAFRQTLDVSIRMEKVLDATARPGGSILTAGYSYGAGGVRNYLVSEVDASGAVLWSDTDRSQEYEANGVGLDAAGNIYALISPVDDRVDPLILKKYDPAGNLLWSFELPEPGTPKYTEYLAVDASGRAYVVHHSRSVEDVHDSIVISTEAISPDGSLEWTDTFVADFMAKSLRVDPVGDIYVVGTLETEIGCEDVKKAMVRKLSPYGTLIWERAYVPAASAAPPRVSGEDLGFDSLGQAYLYASVRNGEAGLGSMLKLGLSGDVLWEQSAAPAATVLKAPVQVSGDAFGSVHAAGTIYDARDNSRQQVAVLSFSQEDGRYLGLKLFGNACDGETLIAAAADGLNGFYAAGNLAKCGSGTNVFVARYFVPMPTATPQFSPAAGTFREEQWVVLGCPTPGARIAYTTDGSDPAGGTAVQVEPGASIYLDRGTAIRAIAWVPGSIEYVTSVEAAAEYLLMVLPPVLSPPGGTYTTGQTVTITSPTAGAGIRYTTDGTLPTSGNGTEIPNGGTVTVNQPITLTAVAIRDGWLDSEPVPAALSFQAAAPVFTPAAGVVRPNQSVKITSATPGAWIAYTTDGTKPSPTNGVQAPSGVTVVLTRSVTLKAMAYFPGWTNSAVVWSAYIVTTLQSATPVFSLLGGTYYTGQTVAITSATAGAVIYYTTNGTIPTRTNGTQIANGGTVLVNRSMTVKAIAANGTTLDSGVSSVTYTLKVTNPTLTPAAGNYFSTQTVTISTPTKWASIRYTTDGTIPTATMGTELANGGTVTVDQSMTVKAIAYRDGWTSSMAVSAAYTLKVDSLTLSPPAGTYTSIQNVTISTSLAGASIHYTTDGTTPSATAGMDLANGGTVTVDKSMTIKVIAYQEGWTSTSVVTAAYVLKVEPLTLSPPAGIYTSAQTVTISTPTAAALIHYTTDGTTPTAAAGLELANGETVTVDKSMTVKAIAYIPGWTPTPVASAAYTLSVEPLTLTPPPTTYTSIQTVTIATPTEKALIHYTTDGTYPSATAGIELANGGTVTVDRTMTIRAMAFIPGWTSTAVVSAAFTLKVEPLTLAPPAGTYITAQDVVIATPTDGAFIHYTIDGTTPSATVGNDLANGGTVTVDRSMTIKAIAFIPGWTPTTVLSAAYTLKLEPLTLAPPAGTYTSVQYVTLSTPTAQALIHYTTDGTTPTAASGLDLENGGTVTVDRSMTIRAVAYIPGWTSTALVTAAYTLKVNPLTLAPAAGTYTSIQSVAIATPTDGAFIHYTTDGTTPSATVGLDLENGGAVTVDRSMTVKAIAYIPGWTPTTVLSAAYTLKVDPLTLTPGATTSNTPLDVAIATPTDGAFIHYTIDGTNPSATLGIDLANGGVVTVNRSMTIKAIAYIPGWTATSVVSAIYTLKVDPLTFTPAPGTYTDVQFVTIATPTAEALIHYTIDGTTPTAAVGLDLANGGTLTVDRTTTIRAVAYIPGWTATTLATVAYTLKVAPLTLTPAAGTYAAVQAVEVATPTDGAFIHYTTDGTTPSATVGNDLANGGTVIVDRSMTVKAIAYIPGWTPTTVVSAAYTLKVEPVTLTPGATTSTAPFDVTIASPTVAALIHYTTDGTTPTAASGLDLENGGTVTVDRSMTIRAVAYIPGWTATTAVSAIYTLKVEPLAFAPAPGTYATPQTVTITTPTAGALIHYTIDGTTPTAAVGLDLDNGGMVTVDQSTTIKAIAYIPGWTATTAVTGTYILKVEPLKLSLAGGTYYTTQDVVIETPTAGALIHYTTDGTSPSAAAGMDLANGGTVTVDRSMTLKAIAYIPGWSPTSEAYATYTLRVEPLTFTPAPGTYDAPQAVTIATPTPDTLIHYTTDGTLPSATAGIELANGGTITVDRSTTLKAIAYRPGWSSTMVATAIYTLKVAPLTLTPPAGTYYADQQVVISSPTAGALIHYTTDGTTPTAADGLELANGGAVTVDRTMTLKAIAYIPGWSSTTVVSGTYTMRVEALTFTPGAGTYDAPQTVTIGTATAGVSIYYTTDGTLPSETAGTELANGGAVTVDRTMTLRAIAYRTGWSSTTVASATYTIP